MVHRAQRAAARAAIARGKGANAALKASIADAETQRQRDILNRAMRRIANRQVVAAFNMFRENMRLHRVLARVHSRWPVDSFAVDRSEA